MTMEKSVERRLKNLECKFSKALQEVNQGLSTKLSETEAGLKVLVIDKRLKNLLRMLISKVQCTRSMITWLLSCLKYIERLKETFTYGEDDKIP